MASRSRLIAAVACGIALGLARMATAQTPGFHLVGTAPGTTGSGVTGLSSSGEVAAGYSFIPGTLPGFTWTYEQGRNDFGLEPGLPQITRPAGISGDGSTVAGITGGLRSFRFRGTGTYQDLGTIAPYPETMARGIDGDGSTIVGQVNFPQGNGSRAFRWTESGGMQNLGVLPGHSDSSAAAVSRDGTTIVGGSGGIGLVGDAFIWRAETGMVALPAVPGNLEPGATAVNVDGSIVVGFAGPFSAGVMWRQGQVIDLGRTFLPRAVSDDGTVVVGIQFPIAAIWTPQWGTEPLSDYLARAGIQVPTGLDLYDATCVSADGLTIGGVANLTGAARSEGFVVTIPAPGVGTTLATILLWSGRRRVALARRQDCVPLASLLASGEAPRFRVAFRDDRGSSQAGSPSQLRGACL